MKYSIQIVQYVKIDKFRYSRFIKKVSISFRRKQSNSSLIDSSDQNKRKSKNIAYRNIRYIILLKNKESYIRKFDNDNISKNMKNLYQMLLKKKQIISQNFLFRKDIFKKTCRKIENRNEAKVIQDIVRLIVSFVETLAIYKTTHLDYLIEDINKS